MTGVPNVRIGVQGWRQFLSVKQSILAKFDVARERAKARRTQTDHGLVLEAAIRDWLTAFLPRKYGVTSGYIVSQGQPDTTTLPQYDVIIYDALESPVLWMDDNPDSSVLGAHRAILVEHARAVIEVKSSFETTTATEAVSHLAELTPLLLHVDSEGERHKRFLPANFLSAVIFGELRKQHEYSTALDALLGSPLPRGHFSGLILRGEGRTVDDSGTIQLLGSRESAQSTVGRDKGSLVSDSAFSNSSQIREDEHRAMLLTWGNSQFAMFAFDLLAQLDGTFQAGSLSSLYGVSWYDPTTR
jgi:hypothetical protein